MSETKLNELLGEYWDAAHAEGRENRSHDTKECRAMKALLAVKVFVADEVEQAHLVGQADADVDPSYSKSRAYRINRFLD